MTLTSHGAYAGTSTIMAKTIFNARDREALCERISRLRPDSARRWGKMTAPQMICHLNDSLEIATGRVPAQRVRTPLANPLLRWLIIYVVPWPKGRARTVPEMLATTPGNWDADVARLIAQLQAAGARGPRGEWAPHPGFGALSGKDYGVLIRRHFSYHLTQFGV